MKTAAPPASRRRPSTSRASTPTATSAARRASIAWSGSARSTPNARRHTSFASVDVLPEVDDTIDIVLRDEDLKRDVFRSAVPAASTRTRPSRASATPTCPPASPPNRAASARSTRTTPTPWPCLKAKLIRMEEEKREAEFAKKYDEKGEVSFGNQIRSYVLQPYQIVKDLRTDHEVGNPRAVLDGGIDGFIEAYLRMKLAKGGADLAKMIGRRSHAAVGLPVRADRDRIRQSMRSAGHRGRRSVREKAGTHAAALRRTARPRSNRVPADGW